MNQLEKTILSKADSALAEMAASAGEYDESFFRAWHTVEALVGIARQQNHGLSDEARHRLMEIGKDSSAVMGEVVARRRPALTGSNPESATQLEWELFWTIEDVARQSDIQHAAQFYAKAAELLSLLVLLRANSPDEHDQWRLRIYRAYIEALDSCDPSFGVVTTRAEIEVKEKHVLKRINDSGGTEVPRREIRNQYL